MKSIRKILAVVAVVVTGFVGTTTPANAVTCWGDYCSGQDPDTTHCADGARALATQESHLVPGHYVQVIWSPTCKTEWARVVGFSDGDDLVAVQRDTGYTQRGAVGRWGNIAWSRMIYSPKMCVYAYWLDYGVPGGPLWDAPQTACA